METYLKWLFTRWYYWLALILLITVNYGIRSLIIAKDFSQLIGYLLGMILILALIFYVFYFIYKKGFKAGQRGKK